MHYTTEHLINENHANTDIETNFKMIHNIKKSVTINILEEFQIYMEYKNNPCNMLSDQLLFSSNPIYDIITKLNNNEKQETV